MDQMKTDGAPEKLKRLFATIPLVRREKIEETKRQLRIGTYRIDTTAVARSLLKEQLLNEMCVPA